jgi:pyruvate, water dikinase
MQKNDTLLWFADVDLNSAGIVGKHTEQLAKLTKVGFPVMPGFVITSQAFDDFLRENALDFKVHQLLSTVAIERPESLMQAEHHIKKLFEDAQLSEEFEEELIDYYLRLGRDEITLTLYEKSPQGRKHVRLDANDEDELLHMVKKAWMEMFTGNALWHRHHHGLELVGTGAEIIVQENILGDTTGTVITIDPKTHAKDKIILITHEPHAGDTYILSKKNLSILDRTLKHTTNLPKLSLNDIEIITAMARDLERFLYFPQEISWVIEDDELYILEVKPFGTLLKEPKETKRKLPIARGSGITKTIGTGVVTIIRVPEDLEKTKSHDIIVVSKIENKHIPHLKKARGVILDSHPHRETVILLQNLGIPAIGNVKHIEKHFRNGKVVTIHGEKGEIYLGGFH